MASLHLQHSSWLSPLTQKPTRIFSSSKTSHLPFKLSFSLSPSNPESSEPTSQNSTETQPEPDPGPLDPSKLAFEKAKAYKKAAQERKSVKIEQNTDVGFGGGSMGKEGNEKQVPDSVKVALEKAKGYKMNKGVREGIGIKEHNSGLKESNCEKIVSSLMDKHDSKTEKLSISSIDFLGFNFADKKSGRGTPARLIPVTDPFLEGDLPEVEILVGDTSKFGDTATSMPKVSQDENSDLYKPKVSTWGVFPRPGNISKTFGGGRNIRPGEMLETAEERAAKDKRTRELLAAYKKKIGLNIDAKLKADCEKALKDGDFLMDSGKINDALPYYQSVMDKLPFQSELHGLAALQWSICQDSLSRRNKARAIYEKLQSHPSAKVSKRARQFMFSFQAMEMMKITGSNFMPKSTGYQNYFEAFVENKANYPLGPAETQDNELNQALPYVIFLISPILFVLYVAVQKGNIK